MFTSAAQLRGTAATAYGVLAALTTLLQARQMLARGTSGEVSGRFFASYAGGYAIWLVYGAQHRQPPPHHRGRRRPALRRADARRRPVPARLAPPPSHLDQLHRSPPQPKARRPPGPKSRLGRPRRPAPAQRTGDRRAADAGPGRVRQRPNDPAGLPGAEPA